MRHFRQRGGQMEVHRAARRGEGSVRDIEGINEERAVVLWVGGVLFAGASKAHVPGPDANSDSKRLAPVEPRIMSKACELQANTPGSAPSRRSRRDSRPRSARKWNDDLSPPRRTSSSACCPRSSSAWRTSASSALAYHVFRIVHLREADGAGWVRPGGAGTYGGEGEGRAVRSIRFARKSSVGGEDLYEGHAEGNPWMAMGPIYKAKRERTPAR
ncbi:hypothetical protein FIBSPDRAFT_895155 [Athelia psychrophila]|uniref:Uncharacterized protein n=1 Tax=Athelia psychrophila TaxID=1759441 RepID=A0A166EZ62_9AGAM|nr:hypothetical protein FIBSPDRAFT_895155 [Fibularhizoctonia sp. CBS 109695]